MSQTHKDLSRRQFLAAGVTGMAAGTMGISGNMLLSSSQEGSSPGNGSGAILQRTLGATGIQLPVVNMGVMNAYDGALVRKSYEIGVRYFDTAAYYQRGQNERMVGEAIKTLGVRDHVIIGTKVYIPHDQRNMPPEQAKGIFLKTAEESLERLQTDHVDILYSHNVQDTGYLNNPGILEALQLLKEQKKTRFIGFTTHSNMAECINDAVRTGSYDVIVTAFNYAMGEDETLINALRAAASKGIGLVAMKTQCAQYWYRQYIPESSLKYYKGRIMHTAVLKWALRHPFIATAIPGYTTYEQMEEDFSVAYDLEYTPEEKQFLNDREVKLSLGYCHQCRQCLSTCPRAVDIPTLMRTHMYATCYSNFHEARDALDSISPGRGLENCSLCKKCLSKCANHIDIPRRIQELKTIYL